MRLTGISDTPITAGMPMARARMAACEELEPLAETTAASRSGGTSAICMALMSSPTSTVCAG